MRSPRLILLLLAALLGTGQAAPAATPKPRIINGVNAAPGAWPAHASVRVAAGGGSTTDCGGTLVSARWVLTAAHCVHDDSFVIFSPSAFLPVRIGSISRFSGGTERTVIAVHRHPSFSQAPGGVPNYDLALLQLAAKVPADVEPMPMIRTDPSQAAFWSAGTTATVVGWGDTESGVDSDTQLKQGQVPIVSDSSCAQGEWMGSFNAASMLCAGRLAVDTCSGDSGGPIVVPRAGVFTLIGVTSWGAVPCGQSNVAGVYARLGAPAAGDWARTLVPTVAFTSSPAILRPGSTATFTAAPRPAGGTPTIAWDTDADGAFDDGSGTSVSRVFPTAGTYAIAVRAEYPGPDDRAAIARDAVAVTVEPPPPPPPPPTPPPPPPPAAAPAPATPPPTAAERLTNGVARARSTMKLATLRTSGVRVRFECERACAIRGRLTLGPVAARRFGLGRAGRSVTIGTGTKRLTQAGRATLTLKLTSRAKRALRNRRRVTISVITELTAGSVTLPGKHAVSVRR